MKHGVATAENFEIDCEIFFSKKMIKSRLKIYKKKSLITKIPKL